jgi:hypothetical protein
LMSTFNQNSGPMSQFGQYDGARSDTPPHRGDRVLRVGGLDPNLSGAPKNHFNWAANAICTAIAAAAWVVSDSISVAAKAKPIPVESLALVDCGRECPNVTLSPFHESAEC